VSDMTASSRRPYLSVASHANNTSALAAYKEAGADEIFFSPGSLFGSGRCGSATRQAVTDDSVAQHLTEAKRVGLGTTLLLNPLCSGNLEFTTEGAQAILQICNWINEYEVDWITVANPWFVAVFKEFCPSVKVRISSHYNCDNLGKFHLFLEDLGVDQVIVSQFANKDFNLLREVTKRWGGERLEIMCTVACITGCAYRNWHNPATGHTAQHDLPYECNHPCHTDISLDANVAVSSFFVRPQDLHFYQEIGINSFKIGERFAAPELNVDCIRYFRGNGPKSALSQLLWPKGTVVDVDPDELDGFYEIFASGQCDGKKVACHDCGHCGHYAEKAVKFDKSRAHLVELEKKVSSHHAAFDGYLDLIKRSIVEE
jgi:collagenase-like PrtC family protease